MWPIQVIPLTQKAVSQLCSQTDHSWDGVKYSVYPSGQPEITVLKIKIPPHTILPWHTHPMPNAAYIVSGTLEVEDKNGLRKTLHPGDVLAEMVNTAHRGITHNQAVEIIVFYAGVTGMPTARPVLN
ncbi:MAG: cupin domain-containing protein [Gammaproteobacteria bacterium]